MPISIFYSTHTNFTFFYTILRNMYKKKYKASLDCSCFYIL